MHKFVEKYFLKGPWDRTGKRIKQFLYDVELKNRQSGNAFAYYVNCRDTFQNNKGKKWREYEGNNDDCLLEKISFEKNTISFGFVVEKETELTKFKEEGHEHILYTNIKENRDDIAPVRDTKKLFQVSSHKNIILNITDQFQMTSFNLPYSFCDCCNEEAYLFVNLRDKREYVLKLKKRIVSYTNNQLRIIDVSKLTIPMLKF